MEVETLLWEKKNLNQQHPREDGVSSFVPVIERSPSARLEARASLVDHSYQSFPLQGCPLKLCLCGQGAAGEVEQRGRYAARLIWRYAARLVWRYAARVVLLYVRVYGGRYDAMNLMGRYAAMKLMGQYAAKIWLWENVADVRERPSCGIKPKVEPRYCKLSSK